MRRTLSMALVAVVSTAGLVAAQVATQEQETPPPSFSLLGLMVYPAHGQPPEQQAKDEAACWDWAEAQTGMRIVIGSVDTEAAAEQAGDAAAQATQDRAPLAGVDDASPHGRRLPAKLPAARTSG